MKNEPFIIIKGKTTSNFKMGDVIRFSMANNSLCEFADGNGDGIEGVVLKTYSMVYSNIQSLGDGLNVLNNEFFIYPNPAGDVLNINYFVAGDGVVRISLFNVFGENVADIVNKYLLKGGYYYEFNLSKIPSGVYMCKMVSGDKSVIVKRLVISK